MEGTIRYIAADSQTNQEDGATYYLVKVELHGDRVGRGELDAAIALGMSGQAEIVVGQESLLRLLVKRIRRTISLG
jgi:hypothetical protein